MQHRTVIAFVQLLTCLKIPCSWHGLSLIGLLFLNGCVTAPVQDRKLLWENKQLRLGIVCKPINDKSAKQYLAPTIGGLIDLVGLAAASAKMENIDAKLNQIQIHEPRELARQIARLLNEQGFSVKIITAPVDLSSYPRVPKRNAGTYPFDLSRLASEHQIERLIYLSIDKYGVERLAPDLRSGENNWIFVSVSLSAFDLKNNLCFWQKTAQANKSVPSAIQAEKLLDYLTRCMRVANKATIKSLFDLSLDVELDESPQYTLSPIRATEEVSK